MIRGGRRKRAAEAAAAAAAAVAAPLSVRRGHFSFSIAQEGLSRKIVNEKRLHLVGPVGR